MSSPEDEDDESRPPDGSAIPNRPSFLQPSRRSRLGRQSRQAPERRIPGASLPAEENDQPALGEEVAEHEPSHPPSETERGETDVRSVPYRPPSRGTETLWTGAPPEVDDGFVPPGGRPLHWRLPLLTFALGIALGGGVGFWAGGGSPGPAVAAATPGAARAGALPPAVVETDAVAPLSPFAELPAGTLAAVVSDLDNAYNSLRAGKFADADASLRAAQERRPSPPGAKLSGVPPGWPELEVERARVRFYAGDLKGADRALDALLRAPGTVAARADALLLRALIQGAQRAPALADDLFAAAVSASPARADIFFFWGNALRTEGKPAESIPKFRAALLRNQFETMDGLIRLKLWISQLQVDKEAPEAAAAIDAALAPPNSPTGYAWMGAAARAVRAEQFAEAAGAFRKARGLLDPVLFRVVLSDPTFAEQNWRPELAEFYR